MLVEGERGTRRKGDEEEGATRRKEQRGGRSDVEEGSMRRVKISKRKMKKWLENASLG